MGFEDMVECSMLSVSSTAAVETVQANVKASRIVLKIKVRIEAGPMLRCHSLCYEISGMLVKSGNTYYRVKALCTILSINRLRRPRRTQLWREY